MYKNRVLVLAMVAIFAFGLLVFAQGCQPPEAEQIKVYKAADLAHITLTRRASGNTPAVEKTIEDEATMQALLDVIYSVTYTKGKFTVSGPKGKYRVLMIQKDDPNKGYAFDILDSDRLFKGSNYYTASDSVDLAKYDAFLD